MSNGRGRLRWIVLGVLVVLVAAALLSGLHDYLNLDYLKQRRSELIAYRDAHPVAAMLYYVLTYVVVTGLSLPGAAILTLAAGAMFGLLWGTLLASIGSTFGATIAFLASRFLFRDIVQSRFGDRLHAINAGVERDGAFYLFTLRLVPLFPFFVVNLLMALTPIRVITFLLVSQVGMLPATAVYVNAGTQLARIETAGDILSLPLLLSFVLLGVFPLATRKLVDWLRRAHQRRQREKDAGVQQTEEI